MDAFFCFCDEEGYGKTDRLSFWAVIDVDCSEIKNTYSMRDIVERYGFHPNRAGFISCPFHQGDRTPSLKVS